MKLKQISIFIVNQPGAVKFPCKVLADAGVDITTLTLADTKDFGILRLITPHWETALNVLKEHKFAVSANDVFALEVDDVPGALSRLLEEFDNHKLNVEYMYASVRPVAGHAVLIFRFTDMELATTALQDITGCRIVDSDRFFSIEKLTKK